MTHLYLIDDNENSFNYVYAALIKYAHHQPIQAEQCCLITNETGKCHIKQGDVLELLKIQENLADAGLTIEFRQDMYA